MLPIQRFAAVFATAAIALAAGTASAATPLAAKLSGYQEVPALNTPASGTFTATFSGGVLTYTLTYANVATGVTQAHIHFGQAGVNGGIMAFLCSNLGGTAPACPAGDGSVTGTIDAAGIIGPTTQGVAAGDLDAAVAAARAGKLYVNAHSVAFPGGEIRGQIKVGD